MWTAWFATRPSTLTWPDYTVPVGSLVLRVAIGLVLSRRQRDAVDFFLAGGRGPGRVVSLNGP